MSANNRHLIKLFDAYRERNEVAFQSAAEAIIADELAANHHSVAKHLKKALGNGTARTVMANELMILPKDRRDGEELVRLQKSLVDITKIVFTKRTEGKVKRILEEQRRRIQLASYGYQPKAKLLFWGGPGCGKTYTAFYLAHELGLPLGVIRLNALVSSFVGDTASHLQRIFDFANSTPMVLLIDEVDAIGKERDDRNEVGELKRVVNSLLQALDSFVPKAGIVVAASNHQYLLDDALWRRFDEIVNFPLPGSAERRLYLQRLLNGVELVGSIPVLARKMNGLSFADINRVTVEAIKTMILDGRQQLQARDIVDWIQAYRKDFAQARAQPLRRRSKPASES
jgi:AAA+ superfamily predicted ATPase